MKNENEIEIFKHNDDMIANETPKNLARAFELLTQLPDDFSLMAEKIPHLRDGVLSIWACGINTLNKIA